MKAQLQRRIVGKSALLVVVVVVLWGCIVLFERYHLSFVLFMTADVAPMVFEAPMSSKSCAKAVILVCTFLTYYLCL